MLTKSQLRAIFEKTEVFVDGHFVLPDGAHTAQAASPMRVLQHPEYATTLASSLAGSFRSHKPQVVLASPTESALWGFELARALHARLVIAEPVDGRWRLAASQAIAPDERVVIAEALWTDRTDLNGRGALVEAAGARVVGLAALIDRTSGDGAPWPAEALWRPEAPLHAPSACPLCQQGVPLT